MSNGLGTIHVRKQRGHIVIQGDGKTPRGQRYIKQTVALKTSSITSPDFKGQMTAAVKEIMAEEGTPS